MSATSTSIQLGERIRELKFDLRAIRELETITDTPLGRVVRNISDLGVNSLIQALTAGLKHSDKGINANLVEKMVQGHLDQGGSLLTLAQAVSEALDGAGLFNAGSPEGNGQTETQGAAR